MGQRFTITEAERKRIKGLYEQESPNRELEIGSLAFTSVKQYIVDVKIKDDYNNNPVDVAITIQEGQIIDVRVENNFDTALSDEEALEFVKQKASEGYFSKLPHHISVNLDDGEVFDIA